MKFEDIENPDEKTTITLTRKQAVILATLVGLPSSEAIKQDARGMIAMTTGVSMGMPIEKAPAELVDMAARFSERGPGVLIGLAGTLDMVAGIMKEAGLDEDVKEFTDKWIAWKQASPAEGCDCPECKAKRGDKPAKVVPLHPTTETKH